MFTTGVHEYLYAATGCYLLALLLYLIQKKRIAIAVLFTGFLIQSLYLTGRGWLGGLFIPNAIFEGPFILPLCIALIILTQSIKKPDIPCTANLVLLIILTLFSVIYAKGIIPPTPRKTTIWAILFFGSESIAHALFYVDAVFAGSWFFHNDKSIDHYHWLLILGFIAYTVAQVTGAIWCFLGWGNTFSWGSRHLSSAAIWTLYAGFLHLKFILRWTKWSAGLAIGGAVFVFIISYGHYLHEMSFFRIGG